MTLAATDVSYAYRRAAVLEGVSASLGAGERVAILGPNGSGKSTLVRIFAGLLRPKAGSVTLDGARMRSISTRKRAARLAMLPQAPISPPGMRVRELVALGRFPHATLSDRLLHRTADAAPIDEAIDAAELGPLADRPLDELSGGERQRAHLAAAIAQGPTYLLLDEPVTALDLHHQLATLALVDRLARERRIGVAMVLHELNHAMRHADRVIVLDRGRVAAEGTPAATLTPELVRRVFRCEAHPVERSGQTLLDFSLG